jgi:HD superfamily phosphohydrolase
MEHLDRVQPELGVQGKWTQAVVIAALCHDLGHGPWSHCFEALAHLYQPEWDHEENGGRILRYIVSNYEVDIDKDVIDAACAFIQGRECPGFPKWLSRIVSNHDCDIDIDKFDYISRDMNRSICSCGFEYDRLIVNCRVVNDQLSWKISEIPTIERLFFNRNDMHERVYQHRVKQAFELMVVDMLFAAEEALNIGPALSDAVAFCQFDCRLQYVIERGDCGAEAQAIAKAMQCRKVYKLIGEIRVKPNNPEGEAYSQLPRDQILEDIAEAAEIPAERFRLKKMEFRYGLDKSTHPLLKIPFWKPRQEGIVTLTSDELSCIVPAYFRETGLRVFITDPSLVPVATAGFEKWKAKKGLR